MPFTTPGGIGLEPHSQYWALALRYIGRATQHEKASSFESRWCAEAGTSPPYAEGLKEGFIYYDAQTNDARLTMALIHTAAQYGAADHQL